MFTGDVHSVSVLCGFAHPYLALRGWRHSGTGERGVAWRLSPPHSASSPNKHSSYLLNFHLEIVLVILELLEGLLSLQGGSHKIRIEQERPMLSDQMISQMNTMYFLILILYINPNS